MPDKVLISIIIPIFNAETTLNQCLLSIKQQDFMGFEVLLVDDHSTDKSAEIMRTWTQKDFRFHDLKLDQMTGAAAARNYGLQHAKGDYVFFLDADDWIESETLSSLYKLAVQTQADLVCCSHIQNRGEKVVLKQDGAPEQDHVFNHHELSDYIQHYLETPYFYTLFVHCWGKLFKTDIIQAHGLIFDESLSQLEDVNFNFKFMHFAKKVAYKQAHLYHHRISNQHNSMSKKSGEEDDFLKKIFIAYHPISPFLSSISKGNTESADRLVNKLAINTIVITIIRLSRTFLKKPSMAFWRKIRLISQSFEVKQCLRHYSPKKGESKLIFYALRSGITILVALAGLIRASVITLRK